VRVHTNIESHWRKSFANYLSLVKSNWYWRSAWGALQGYTLGGHTKSKVCLASDMSTKQVLGTRKLRSTRTTRTAVDGFVRPAYAMP
jgi:hypothetical protein